MEAYEAGRSSKVQSSKRKGNSKFSGPRTKLHSCTVPCSYFLDLPPKTVSMVVRLLVDVFSLPPMFVFSFRNSPNPLHVLGVVLIRDLIVRELLLRDLGVEYSVEWSFGLDGLG